jgi:hypothetical protein
MTTPTTDWPTDGTPRTLHRTSPPQPHVSIRTSAGPRVDRIDRASRSVTPGRRQVSQANTLAGRPGAGKIDHEVIHVRTRLRQMRIGARTFVWRAEIRHVQGIGDCHRCIRLRVWGAGKTSQALQADLLSVAWPAPLGACVTDGAYPTPADVRAVISYALEHGWQPERLGGTFVLSEREHAAAFTLPDFLLTDRLRTPEGADPTARVTRAYELRPRA